MKIDIGMNIKGVSSQHGKDTRNRELAWLYWC